MWRLLIVLCLIGQALAAQVVRLYPVDDTAREPAFRSYVGKLRSAVATRNTAALRKLVDDEVAVGPAAEDKGWAKFKAKWRPDDPQDQRLWSAVADLLSVGFIREHPNLFLSPYLVWRFPDGLSRRAHLVVVRDHAALRESPSLNAPSVATLSFDIVRRLEAPKDNEGLVQWVHVQTLDGRSGYVNARDVMSPIMPRAQFGLRRGRWLLIALED
jgi:hypothetical protein